MPFTIRLPDDLHEREFRFRAEELTPWACEALIDALSNAAPDKPDDDRLRYLKRLHDELSI